MDSAVKQEWIEALRSGNYEQTHGVLRRGGGSANPGHCCLGVLCEIAVKQGVIPEPTFDEDDNTYDFGDSSYNYPPDAVMEWAGLGSYVTDPQVPREVIEEPDEYNGEVGLADLNDAHSFSFDQIADVIETYL